MIFVKTFKGYEDKTGQLDDTVNEWLKDTAVDVIDIRTAMSHPSATGTLTGGDVLYTVIYRADAPVD